MRGQLWRLSWYRARATFNRRVGGYLSLALVIAFVGGIAMGSIAAARRTQSAYPAFLAASNASDLFFSSFGTGGPSATGNAQHSVTTVEVTRLPDVRRVESVDSLLIARLATSGAPELGALTQLSTGGSVDGLFFNQDRVAVTEGRMADPNNPDEFVATATAARLLGLRVGQSATFGDYSADQLAAPGFGTPRVAPRLRFSAKLVGIVVPNDEVVEDDVDSFEAEALFTPALTQHAMEYSTGSQYGLQLVHDDRDIPYVERELAALVPKGTVFEFHQTSLIEARVERVMKPDSIALGVFGAIAGATALVLAGLAISRQLRAGDADLQVLRALGAGPVGTASDGLIGLLSAVVLGTLLAVGVAIGLSPLAPIGPVRHVELNPGFAFDWTVFAIGALVFIGGLAALAGALSYRFAPHRATHGARAHTSILARKAAAVGLPTSAVIGVRRALEPGAGRTAVPVRSAMVGSAIAVATVVATLTFGSGLHTLVTQPALYGWNWTYLVYPGNQNIPQATLTALDHDPDVAAASGVTPEQAQIDGREVPVLLGASDLNPGPPILTGHAVEAANEIVLGGATLQQLHKRVGDTVTLTYGARQNAPVYVPPTQLVIVGTATFPAIGYPSSVADHTSMGTGAIVSTAVEPAALQQALTKPDPLLNGPSMVLVRLRPGLDPAAGHANLERVVTMTNKTLSADPNAGGDSIALLGVQRPAEIVNYQSMGDTPVILAVALGAGAVVALGLTLAASARRRRRDLALLKTLGFTARQLAAAVAWQASVAALVGLLVGVPAGIALGRQLWTLFARDIYAVPKPTVPALLVLFVAVSALLLANIAAAIPGRIAARAPTALVLHAE